MPGVLRDQKRASDPLELESHMTVSHHHEDAGTQIQDPCKSAKYSQPLNHFSSLPIFSPSTFVPLLSCLDSIFQPVLCI